MATALCQSSKRDTVNIYLFLMAHSFFFVSEMEILLSAKNVSSVILMFEHMRKTKLEDIFEKFVSLCLYLSCVLDE